MRLCSLSLEGFRNYAAMRVELSDAPIQMFLGENGQGKTNLLEAVGVLSLTRSCRGADDGMMVRWGAHHYRIRGVCRSDDGREVLLETVSEIAPRKRRAFFVNDVRVSLGEFLGVLPTVTFLPQDLALFSGPPAERRRFMDQLLSQESADYLRSLSTYQKVLQQRNALLKQIAAGRQDATALDTWDDAIADAGARITLNRLELMETLNLTFADELASLGEQWENVELVYVRSTVTRSLDALRRESAEQLRAQRQRDVTLQSTGTGPHRHDWRIEREGRALSSFASRGQERTAILALLLIQVSYLELKRGEKPLILLDDAFSELDDAHQHALLRSFRAHQVLMTGTRIPVEAAEMTVWEVKEGEVAMRVREDEGDEDDKEG